MVLPIQSSVDVTETNETGDLCFNYSILVLIINKSSYRTGNVEIQLEGLSIGLDQNPFPVELFYCFAPDETKREKVNKELQIGHFYKITGKGMKAEAKDNITFYHPRCEGIDLNDIPRKIASLLVGGIPDDDFNFKYYDGLETMNQRYSKHDIFPAWLCSCGPS